MTKDELMDPAVIGSWLSSIVRPIISTQAAVASIVTIGTSSGIIVNSNSSRLGFMIYNNSANSGYFTFGTHSSSNSCSFIVATFANFSWTAPMSYTGPIACVRNAGTGTVIVTEFLA